MPPEGAVARSEMKKLIWVVLALAAGAGSSRSFGATAKREPKYRTALVDAATSRRP